MTLLAVTACGSSVAEEPAQESECSLDGPSVALPADLPETSGVAVSIRDPSLIWTHNDRGYGSFLYAVDRDGRVHATLELIQSNSDRWEANAR